jgi:hypothetical protein
VPAACAWQQYVVQSIGAQLLLNGISPFEHVATAPPHVLVLALVHATPAWQQLSPHGVVPAGQPHAPVAAFLQAIPALQQHGPQGVVPGAQGAAPTVVGPEHDTRGSPASDGAAPRAISAPRATPIIRFRACRRDVPDASALESSSNCLLI